MLPIRLVLPLPPTQNHAYHVDRGRLVKSGPSREYVNVVAFAAVSQHPAVVIGDGPLALEVRWFLRRDRDIDGVKGLQDAVAAALGFDDRIIRRLVVEKFDAAEGEPRVEVDILPYEKGVPLGGR